MRSPQYSVIVPVFNRPQEIDELLSSLVVQSFVDFEVIVVEDGSTIRCDDVVDKYRDKLQIQYFFKPNAGPGPSRNFGFQQARGRFFVVFDSDCVIPATYFEAVEKSIQDHQWDAWGGPDQAHENFTVVQRAMGYTMSSFLTTGGIRGGKKHIGSFQPRSFNMGMSRYVFEQTQGFQFTHFAEDIELSIRMKKAGFKIGLIPQAFVYHKRRTSFGQFFKQVFNFGRGRVLVGRQHPSTIKPAHWFPSVFLVGLVLLWVMPFFSLALFCAGLGLVVFYLTLIGIFSFKESRDLRVAILSVPSALLQLIGYGAGFLAEWFKIIH
jgi:glycosyltransferase involved in cell wall biosynthesis